MGVFTYSRNIPNPPDSPAFDVTLMQQNAQSINDLIAVEHQGFNTISPIGGYHKTVTFAETQTTPALAESQTQIYPMTFGTGATSYLETYTSAALQGGSQINGYLPFVKYMVNVTVSAVDGALTPTTDYLAINVGAITQSGGRKTFVFNFTTALPNNTYYIFSTADTGATFTTVNTARSTASVTLNLAIALSPGSLISFMVI